MSRIYRSRNRHPDGHDILKKLGIVERSMASFSEDDEEAKKYNLFNNTSEMMSESEEEVIFEKESFLKRAPHISLSNGISSLEEPVVSSIINRKGNRFSWHLFLLHAAFFVVGLCSAIMGPTVFSLKSHGFEDNLTGLFSVISLNAVGILVGIIFGEIACKKINAFCWIALSLLFCAIFTLTIPWCTKSSSILFIFIVQGLFIGLIEKGVYQVYYATWRNRHKIYLCLYLSLSIGSALAPLLVSSFLAGNNVSHSPQVATMSINSVSPPKLFFKRSATNQDSSNKTFLTATFAANFTNSSNFVTNLCENGTHCFNYTTTPTFTTSKISTSTTKAKKPVVADGTNIDPLHLRADYNKQPVPQIPRPAPPVITSTSTVANTKSSSANVSTSGKISYSTSLPKTTPKILTSAVSSARLMLKPTEKLNYSETNNHISLPTKQIRSTTTTTKAADLSRDSSTNSSLNEAEPKLFTFVYDSYTTSGMVPENFSSYQNYSSFNLINIDKNLSDYQNDSLLNEIWTNVLQSTDQFSDTDFAYLLVSITIFAVFSLYAITCCLTSCCPLKGGLMPPFRTNEEISASSPTLTFSDVFTKRANFCAALIAVVFCFLSFGFENLMSNLLTFYCGRQNPLTGVYVTTAFWSGTALSRFLAINCYRQFWRTNYLLCCFGAAFASCGLIVVFRGFSTSAPILLLFLVFIIGLSIGFLTPNIFCWFNEELTPTRWFGVTWLLTEQSARLIFVCLDVHWLEKDDIRPRVVPISTLILLVSLCVVTIFARKIVVQTSRLNATSAAQVLITRKVKSSTGRLLEYHRHVDETDGFETE